MYTTLVLLAVAGHLSFLWGKNSFKFSTWFKVLQTLAALFIVLIVLTMINGA